MAETPNQSPAACAATGTDRTLAQADHRQLRQGELIDNADLAEVPERLRSKETAGDPRGVR
jgi:hypothetical protein